MRVPTLMTISICLALTFGCSNKTDFVQGPIKDISDIKVGTPKNEIVRRLGKPLNWATVKGTNNQMTVTTVFNLNAAMREMPADEIWLFEYGLADGRKYVIHLSENKVAKVVEGPLFKT